jgi:hypothetical protein
MVDDMKKAWHGLIVVHLGAHRPVPMVVDLPRLHRLHGPRLGHDDVRPDRRGHGAAQGHQWDKDGLPQWIIIGLRNWKSRAKQLEVALASSGVAGHD